MYFSGIPSNLMLHKFGARIWNGADSGDFGERWPLLTGGALGAAVVCAAIFTGAAEGIFPGVALYLTYWFRQREQAQCIALFLTGFASEQYHWRTTFRLDSGSHSLDALV